ncbi:predicted protein [Streptomyces iranensis]|uniref:Uncharacterized protein n=1 Tax=Streptomyces iranensis TaxID=576784 RepID=A0A060ZCU7_9ACTN|nr:hypothetical protein [Streptomyces iranensis]CDR02454.1 predicted protein [Streptomyces iranensis]
MREPVGVPLVEMLDGKLTQGLSGLRATGDTQQPLVLLGG